MVVLLALAALLLGGGTITAQDGGGQSGAEFLLSPSAPRSDAMGGVADAQGDPLEGMFFNPSMLMLDDSIQLNVGITPLPNGITDAAVTFGAPIGPGMLGVAAQLVSLGEFTYVNASGQPQGTLTLFDAAGSAGYAAYVWDHLSVGGNAKFIYRTLGDSTAVGGGVDLGATWWFETPHIGQRPKPPTIEELEARRDRELGRIESEKENRTEEAAGEVAELRKEVTGLEEDLVKVETDIAEAEEGEDTTELEAELAETEAALADARSRLEDAEEAASGDLAEIEAWYEEQVAEAQAAHAARVAELRFIESERARLFEVVNDPDAMLTSDAINGNIEDAIQRTREFQSDRTASLREANAEFRRTRSNRISEIAEKISSYEESITEIVGPDANRLRREIDDLEESIAELEAAEVESEEVDNSDQIDAAEDQLNEARDQLDELQSDPWVRRLQRRIEDKEEEVAEIQAAIEEFDADTTAAIEALDAQTERRIAEFEALREELNTDLRRAQLRFELDGIDARNERAAERAALRYENSEQEIYQTLLAAMYDNEENIFDAQIDLAYQDSENRTFDTEAELANALEAEEDDFAFQERLLTRQIADINSAEPVDEAALEAARQELEQLRADHDAALDEIAERQASFDDEESARLKRELNAIRAERQKVRLIYLQTDDPYRNTTITLAVRNLGTNLKFEAEGYPMPRTAALGLSYAVVNTDMHTVRLSTEAELPLYGFDEATPFYEDIQVGVGLEYGFANFLDIRAGYSFGTPERSFSVGFGVDFTLGFSSYAVDYVFRPIPDYGFVNSFGVAISL